MKKSLNVINQAAGDCGACNVPGCASYIPASATNMNPRYKETSEAGLAALVLC